jgi:hypothetical protein
VIERFPKVVKIPAEVSTVQSVHRNSVIILIEFNAREPMSLFELQEWLGHRSPRTTQHSAKITPTKLAKSYTDAGYFERNIRAVKVLIDQEAIRSRTSATDARGSTTI